MQQVLQSFKVLQKVLQNLKSIAISIAQYRKFCNKYCKILEVLQYSLQNLKRIAILIAKYQSVVISIAKSQNIAILCYATGTTPDDELLTL